MDDEAILAAMLEPPSERLGVMHRSIGLLARQPEVSDATVVGAWRNDGVKPCRWEGDVVAVNLEPSTRSCYKKCQIQALNCCAPILVLAARARAV